LGTGIPLLPIEPTAYSQQGWAASPAPKGEPLRLPLLRLDRQRAFPDGSIELVYAPASTADALES
jgi:hypothetical protein